MLDIKPVSATNPEKAAEVFFRDGFVALKDVLSPDQLAYAQEGAHRVVDEQMADIPLEDANRGFARYSFGSQIHHPEWAQLVELPSLLPILDEIWGTEDYTCSGGVERNSEHADSRFQGAVFLDRGAPPFPERDGDLACFDSVQCVSFE